MTAEEKRKHRLAHPKTHPEENNKINTETFKKSYYGRKTNYRTTT